MSCMSPTLFDRLPGTIVPILGTDWLPLPLQRRPVGCGASRKGTEDGSKNKYLCQPQAPLS